MNLPSWVPIRKIRAILWAALAAALVAVAQVVTDYNWADFGPFGPAVGMAVAAGIGWLVRMTKPEPPAQEPGV